MYLKNRKKGKMKKRTSSELPSNFLLAPCLAEGGADASSEIMYDNMERTFHNKLSSLTLK